jgi:serine acetyltransferase
VPSGTRELTWGIDVERRNRATVQVLLWLLSHGPSRWAPVNRSRRALRDALGLCISSDVRTSHFGQQLYLPHPYGIVVHARVRIGECCTIFQNVTLGEDHRRPGVPTLGDDVIVGAGAAILGLVTVGDGARIGANAVVIADVPPGAVAVGVPARIVQKPATPAASDDQGVVAAPS